jgi:hypothetical protein
MISVLMGSQSGLTDGLTCRRFELNKIAEGHFFYRMAAADRAGGGQVEPVLGGFIRATHTHIIDIAVYAYILLRRTLGRPI